ncbi:MAG TPA: type II toxin-antitoxin system RelE/ParE family toxin [Steroidobacteraceae bacterium]
MRRPLFAPRARGELVAAAAAIAEENPPVAEMFVSVVEESAARVCVRPNLARVEPKLANDRFRFWSVRGFPYLLVVDTVAEQPRIGRIVHQAQDLPTALRDI